jgi:ssDNA-binding protein
MTAVTPKGRIASCSLHRPRGSPSNPAKLEYYIHIVFPTEAFETPEGKRFKAAVDKAAQAFAGPDFAVKAKSGQFRYPIRPVDSAKAAEKGWGAVAFDMNLKSGQDFRPKVVDINLDPVLDSEEAYPGRWVRVSTAFYTYPAGKSPIPGLGISLNNVQLLEDGERFAGSRGDGSEFGDVGGLASDDDDLNDLM